MLLHPAKKEAVIQLTNCISFHNVKTIKELGDGTILVSFIDNISPEKTVNLQGEIKQAVLNHNEDKAKNNDLNDSEKLCSVDESSKETEPPKVRDEHIAVQIENGDICSEFIDVECISKSCEDISIDGKDVLSSVDDKSSPPVQNIDAKDEDLSKIYKIIQCFIDEKYNLQSESLVSYEECMKGNEFELAKVALFVESEIVQHNVKANNALIQTLSLMELKVQQDLKDCFNLFINERSKITETDLQKLLSSPASYNGSPAKTPFITPKRACASKYKRSPSSSPLQESFIDSPLKTYFESPIFTKKDIITKDKEIFKTRQILYEEEVKVNTLQVTVDELKKELKIKNKEIRTLKNRIKEIEDTEKEEDCQNCAMLVNSLKEKEKDILEIKALKDEQLDSQMNWLSKKFEDDLGVHKIEFSKILKEVEIEAKQQCELLNNAMDEIKKELLEKEEHIKNLIEELEEKTKECEISKEKLSAVLIEKENITEYSIRGESIGGVIEKENEELRQRVKQLELIALSKEKDVINAMVQCTENSLDCEAVVINKNVDVSPSICDINKQDSFLRSTRPTETVSCTLNSVEKSKSLGALWEKYNDSMTDTEIPNEICILEKTLNNLMSSLQKFETNFLKEKDKRIKITSRANGSNGLVSSYTIKDLTENLKSFKKSLLCLPQGGKVISDNDCDSKIAVSCDTCLQKKEEMPSSVPSSVSQDSAILLEKTKELDILKEQYLTTAESLHQKENELRALKRKFILERKEHLQNVKSLRQLEMKHQKLESELKTIKLCEENVKKLVKKERLKFKLHEKDLKDKYAKICAKYYDQQSHMKSLHEESELLEKDLAFSAAQINNLQQYIKMIEKQIKLDNCQKSDPARTNKNQVPCTSGTLNSFEELAHRIPKTELLSSTDEEASSSNADFENVQTSALFTIKMPDVSLQRDKAFPLNCDKDCEDSFILDKCLSGIGEESLNRVPDVNRRNTLCMLQPETYVSSRNYEEFTPNRVVELNRRNTLCMPHLRSCYPAEGAPLNIPDKLSMNSVDFAKKESESGNREPAGKKRKLSEMKTEDQLRDVLLTPSQKMLNTLKKTPSSLTKLLKFVHVNRGFARPKPD